MRYGPQVKLLMDVLGETMDDILCEPVVEDEEVDIEQELKECHDTDEGQE